MHESDRRAFLRTILDDPTSDTPRLIFADWLDEHGDHPRAEFIRLQCRIARGIETEAELQLARLRESELLAEHRVQWVNELPDCDGVEWEDFERGFVTAIRADSPHGFFTHRQAIFDAAPIELLRLHRFYSEDAKELARLSCLSQIRTLDFENGNAIGNGGIYALSRSSFLRELRELRLRSNSIGAAGARSIGGSEAFEKLETLWLDRNDVFDGVRSLAQSETLKSLRILRLSNTLSGFPMGTGFFDGVALEKVIYLDLDSNQIDDDAAIALARSSQLRNLTSLFLSSNQIGDAGIIALANSPVFEQLRYLFLRRNRIGEAGARALAESPYLEHVRELILGENRIGASADLLRARFGSRAWVN